MSSPSLLSFLPSSFPSCLPSFPPCPPSLPPLNSGVHSVMLCSVSLSPQLLSPEGTFLTALTAAWAVGTHLKQTFRTFTSRCLLVSLSFSFPDFPFQMSRRPRDEQKTPGGASRSSFPIRVYLPRRRVESRPCHLSFSLLVKLPP